MRIRLEIGNVKRQLMSAALVTVMLGGCAPRQQDGTPGPIEPAPSPGAGTQATGTDEVVARVQGRPITMEQLQRPLLGAYGLNFLLNLVQLEVAQAQAEQAGITISDADVRREVERTLEMMLEQVPAGTERERVLEQFLQQQRLSREEFDMAMRTNAYLRKLAEPLVKGRINDQTLREAFNQQYGQTVRVRHIQLSNLAEVAEAKRRLAAGESFEQVARELSRNPRTAPLGGELPPFTRDRPDLPEAFRQAAFALKEGEISDPVQAEGAFHLIKLDKRLEPKAVKFEDVKESLREDLTERLTQATMRQLRQELAQRALGSLHIDNPILKKQYEQRLAEQEADLKDREAVRRDLERRHAEFQQRQATQPTTTTTAPTTEGAPPTEAAPATEAVPPVTAPSTRDAAGTQPGVLRPPATGSGT